MKNHDDEKPGCCGGETDESCCAPEACACEAEGEANDEACCGDCACGEGAWEPCPVCGAEGECPHYNNAGEPVATEEQMIECGIGEQHRSLFISLGFSLHDIARIAKIKFQEDGTMIMDRSVAHDDPRAVDVMMALSRGVK